jgi:site-specific recombinase XerD
MREAVKKAGIRKTVCVHTLRHSYATHLLEDGLDIVTIKELMGHECIESTMVYLHIARPEKRKAFSPFDTLYGEAKV